MVSILSDGVSVLMEDAQRISNEALQSQLKVNNLSEDVLQVKSAVEETENFTQGVVPSHEILLQELTSLEELIEGQQCTSFDGCFIWKITGVREKLSKCHLRL